jgi:hypothetical protein
VADPGDVNRLRKRGATALNATETVGKARGAETMFDFSWHRRAR